MCAHILVPLNNVQKRWDGNTFCLANQLLIASHLISLLDVPSGTAQSWVMCIMYRCVSMQQRMSFIAYRFTKKAVSAIHMYALHAAGRLWATQTSFIYLQRDACGNHHRVPGRNLTYLLSLQANYNQSNICFVCDDLSCRNASPYCLLMVISSSIYEGFGQQQGIDCDCCG